MKKFLAFVLVFALSFSAFSIGAYAHTDEEDTIEEMERVVMIFNSEEEKSEYLSSHERDISKLYTYVVLTGRPVMRYTICLACGDSYMYTSTIEEETRNTTVSCPYLEICPDVMIESRKFTANICVGCNYYRETGTLGYRYKVACMQDVTTVDEYYYINSNSQSAGDDIHCWTSSYPSYSFRSPMLNWATSEMV